MSSRPLFHSRVAPKICLSHNMFTFNIISLDSLDRNIRIISLVIPLIDITILPRPYLPLEDIVIYYLWHINLNIIIFNLQNEVE